MIKKKMGLGRIMEDKKIISVRRIMEDLFNKQKKWWYFKGIMDDKKKDGFETNYGRSGWQKKQKKNVLTP